MNFDDQLYRYFGSADLARVSPEALAAGIERMLVDLGLETDDRRRFALWSMLHMLRAAPDLEAVFKNEADRDAARNHRWRPRRLGPGSRPPPQNG